MATPPTSKPRTTSSFISSKLITVTHRASHVAVDSPKRQAGEDAERTVLQQCTSNGSEGLSGLDASTLTTASMH